MSPKPRNKTRALFLHRTIGSLARGKSWNFEVVKKWAEGYRLEKENKEIWILDDGSRHIVDKLI